MYTKLLIEDFPSIGNVYIFSEPNVRCVRSHLIYNLVSHVHVKRIYTV